MSCEVQKLATRAMRKAFSDAGNIKALAERLGYSYSRVRSWSARGYVPANECRAVSNALDHSVSVLALLGCEDVGADSASNVSSTGQSTAACS